MATGIEKMIQSKIEGFLADTLGITPETLFATINQMQAGVANLFASNKRIERKMDAILTRAGFTAEQIAELNNDHGNGSGVGSPAIEHQRNNGN
jgi:pyrroline-5-carboxylate reductase